MGSGLEVEQGRYLAVTRCHGLGNRVRQRPGVGRGIAYGVPADEIDRWSQNAERNIDVTGPRSPILAISLNRLKNPAHVFRQTRPSPLDSLARPSNSPTLRFLSHSLPAALLDGVPSAFLWW